MPRKKYVGVFRLSALSHMAAFSALVMSGVVQIEDLHGPELLGTIQRARNGQAGPATSAFAVHWNCSPAARTLTFSISSTNHGTWDTIWPLFQELKVAPEPEGDDLPVPVRPHVVGRSSRVVVV